MNQISTDRRPGGYRYAPVPGTRYFSLLPAHGNVSFPGVLFYREHPRHFLIGSSRDFRRGNLLSPRWRFPYRGVSAAGSPPSPLL